jgi:hypothetical protein
VKASQAEVNSSATGVAGAASRAVMQRRLVP